MAGPSTLRRLRPVAKAHRRRGRPAAEAGGRRGRRAGPGSRLHRAASLEDRLNRALSRLLVRRGWRPRVLGYTGYGSPTSLRVFARVLLSPPERAGQEELPGATQRGWRAFASLPVAEQDVTIEVCGVRRHVRTDRSGYVDAVVEVPEAPPGWAPVVLSAPGAPRTRTDALVVPRGTTRGVVSDIDDTVLVTRIPRPLLAAWNTFVRPEHARVPVPGMAGLLRELTEGGVPLVYLSTGAWNVAPALTRFFARHGLPPGPMLLTDWGPTATGWFRSGRGHKQAALDRLAREFPEVRWVLVGDDGQHDPALYRAFAAAHPGAVLAVAIRQLSAVQQVLAHGTASPQEEPGGAGSDVPWVVGPDGDALRAGLRRHGLL